MPTFDLTAEQEAIAFKCLDAARIDFEAGRPGIVLGQIGRTKYGEVFCNFNFIDHEKAKKIQRILTPNDAQAPASAIVTGRRPKGQPL